MTTWLDTKEILLAELREARAAHFDLPENIDDVLSNSFLVALSEYVAGKPDKLIAYLRSDATIPNEFRENLATVMDDGFKRNKRGRPRRQDIRFAATAAKSLYRRWRNLNKEHGISDWGVRNKMLEDAVRIAISEENHSVSFEEVYELITRGNYPGN